MAADHGSADGMWTLESVRRALDPVFTAVPPEIGFTCEDTLALATETIGFAAPAGSAGHGAEGAAADGPASEGTGAGG
jgi:hypothetical protein